MKTRRINWKKIGVITYDKFEMPYEALVELNYAYECYDKARWNCDTKRASYINNQITKRQNFVLR